MHQGYSSAGDQELLDRFNGGEEAAFTELVRRHCNLVWAAAHRVSGDGETARDVAQTVFTDLARKAGRLPRKTVLAGWLYRAACLAAAKHIRGEMRRALREREAMRTQELTQLSAEETRAAELLLPLLDAAMAELSDADRDAVVLRFFADRSLAEIGRQLGTGEDAAQKRVSRALEKLRETLRRRGVPTGSGVIAAALISAGTQAAPAGLAASLAVGALAGAGVTAGAAASFMVFMKSKIVLGVAGGLVVAALATQQRSLHQLGADNAALRQKLAESATGTGLPVIADGADGTSTSGASAEHLELLRLRGEIARLRQAAAGSDLARRGPVIQSSADPAKASLELAKADESARVQTYRTVDALKKLAMAARIYSSGHQDRLPTTFEEMQNELALQPDGSLPGGVPLELFEFFPHQRAISWAEPQMILFCEKGSRQLPDGSWQRVYAMIDGSAQTHVSKTGDFSDYELQGTGTAANTPGK